MIADYIKIKYHTTRQQWRTPFERTMIASHDVATKIIDEAPPVGQTMNEYVARCSQKYHIKRTACKNALKALNSKSIDVAF